MLLRAFVGLLLVVVSIMGRSLREKRSTGLWQPPSGTREDFFRCQGMPCDQWERVVAKVKRATAMSAGLDPDTDDMPGDETEGCFWYSEDQIDRVLQDMSDPSGQRDTQEGEEDVDKVADLLHRAVGQSGQLSRRQKRKVDANLVRYNRKWKNPIIYKFDGSHETYERELIRKAFQHWQSRTCLRFFEIGTSAELNIPHLLVSKEGRGCYSYIGQSFEGAQMLNLASECLSQFGTSVHEIGHALGFWHEHQRADRDDYITVLEDKLMLYKSQFFKQSTETEVPYDYGSVMHYAWNAGSYIRQQTMVPLKDEDYKMSMGQRVALSYLDVKAINLEYCSASCRLPPAQPCRRGGYQDPNDCTRCVCPDGFGGAYCETAGSAQNAVCGGVVVLTEGGTSQIQTPGYDDPMHYDDHIECNWLITAPRDNRVVLSFDGEFGMYCRNREICNHWVEVKYGTNLEIPGPRYCCYTTPEKTLKSNSSEMVVVVRANVSTEWSATRRGFRASLTTERLPSGFVPAVTPSPPQPTANPPGTTWSEWKRCQNSQCKCGGCSISTRYRLCSDGKKCVGDLAASESRPCDSFCGPGDTELVYAGTFFERSCPVCCTNKGFVASEGKCVKTSNQG